MQIHHLGIWTNQLEALKSFYSTYFQAQAGQKYTNPAKGFESYFLSFPSGARLELMHAPGLSAPLPGAWVGLAHLAISTGSRQAVEELTAHLKQDGYTIASPPRVTGDGYFESVVLDPDGNRVEITV